MLAALLSFVTLALAQVDPCIPTGQRAPRGYNTWDSLAGGVTEANVLIAAAWVRDNLLQYGYDTITIDGGWYTNLTIDAGVPGVNILNEYGLPLPDPARFPSGLKGMSDKIHAMGLKFGAWLIRGIPIEAALNNLPIAGSTYHAQDAVADPGLWRGCVWDKNTLGVNSPSPAATAWFNAQADYYVANGLDWVKADCMLNMSSWFAEEVADFATAFHTRAPNVTISWSPGGPHERFTPEVAQYIASHTPAWGKMYRVTEDFHDQDWNRNPDSPAVDQLIEHLTQAALLSNFIGAGDSFPDLDMLPFGRQADGTPTGRKNLFTEDMQRLIMTLWSISRAPLIVGARIPLDADDTITLPLLTNAAVLDVNANSCRNTPTQVLEGDNTTALFAWTAATTKGESIVALFNGRSVDANVSASAPGFAIGGCATNLWSSENEGPTLAGGVIRRLLPPYSSGLWRVGACSGE